MATFDYGRQTANASTAASSITEVAPVAGTSGGTYTFAATQGRVVISNHPDSGDLVRIRMNGAATATVYDYVLMPGERIIYPEHTGDAVVQSVGVWLDSGATAAWKTGYQIAGWN